MLKIYLWRQRLVLLLVVSLVSLIMLGIYYFLHHFRKPSAPRKSQQQITMVHLPEPKPPSPQEKPKPEPEVKPQPMLEPMNIPQQEPKAVQKPTDEPVSDAPAGGNGDSADDGWNMQGGAVRIGGSGGGSMILWYGGQIQRQLEDSLQQQLANTVALQTDYSVIINVWVDAAGRISRTDLTSSSGKTEVDAAIRAALTNLRIDIGKAPPEDLPQPIKIRWNARV